MMASNEITEHLKWKRLIIYEIFSYRTHKPLITGEKPLEIQILKMRYCEFYFSKVLERQSVFHYIDFCRRFAHLLAKKDVCSPEVKKELLKKVKSAISATAERFSGYMQNVSTMLSGNNYVYFVQCLDCIELLSSFNCLTVTWAFDRMMSRTVLLLLNAMN